MSLSSLYLDAFSEVVRQRSFSQAAKKLHLTQSALSQRVLNLEKELGSTLFLREPSGLRLTETGERLLRYTQARDSLEQEFFRASPEKFQGLVRVAGFSTVLRSVLLPILSPLPRAHPGLQLDLVTAELRELPKLLLSGATDFLLLTQPLEKQGIENHLLGYEENVLVRSTSKKPPDHTFLDHDAEDDATFAFLRHQGGKQPKIVRTYLDEMYAILDGAKLGLGYAVAPLHIVKHVKGLEVVPEYKPLKVPVYLTYYSQAFYTPLQEEVIRLLKTAVPGRL